MIINQKLSCNRIELKRSKQPQTNAGTKKNSHGLTVIIIVIIIIILNINFVHVQERQEIQEVQALEDRPVLREAQDSPVVLVFQVVRVLKAGQDDQEVRVFQDQQDH